MHFFQQIFEVASIVSRQELRRIEVVLGNYKARLRQIDIELVKPSRQARSSFKSKFVWTFYLHTTPLLLLHDLESTFNLYRKSTSLFNRDRILTFHSIYDYFALLKDFNTNTLNFHQYFKDKLSSHQPSHMYNTRHRTNNNFNTCTF